MQIVPSLRWRVAAPLICFAALAGCGGGGGDGGGSGSPPPGSGTIELLAGSLKASGTADGPGTAADFNQPKAVAQDASGVTYVADSGNHTIRRIAPDGTVSTLAGTPGVAGSADGRGAAARFASPAGIVVDPRGGVIVADTGNHTLRRVTVDGTVTTYAGAAGEGSAADGPVALARFASPRALAFDTSGRLLVGDESGAVRAISPAGDVSTFAGRIGELGDAAGDRGNARFREVSAIAVDASGTVYVAEAAAGRVRRLDPQANALPWGQWAQGFLPVASPRGLAVRGPDLVVLSSGLLQYGPRILQVAYSNLQRVAADGQAQLIAGAEGGQNGVLGLGSADGAGGAARFHYPEGIALAPSGRLLVADTQNHAVRQVDTQDTVSTLAGGAGLGRVDGAGLAARFFEPTSIAATPDGVLLVADSRNGRVRSVTAGGTVATRSYLPEDGPAAPTEEIARVLTALAVSPAGTVYLSRTFGSAYTLSRVEGGRLREFATVWSSALAADAAERVYHSNGPVSVLDAPGSSPRHLSSLQARGLAVAPGGRMYAAMFDHSIRVFEPDGGSRVLAGVPGEAGAADGTTATARFSNPAAIALAPGGDVYVADDTTIRRIAPDGSVRTVVGSAAQVLGPPALLRAVGRVRGLAWLDGVLYATADHAILKITPLR